MIVTATELANNSQSVLEQVIQNGETVQIQRNGKTVAQMPPVVGVSRDELLQTLRQIRWTDAESAELKQAMDAASEVFGYAGRD